MPYRKQPRLTSTQEQIIIKALACVFGLFACLQMTNNPLHKNTEQASKETIEQINTIRSKYSRPPIAFDPRVFALATARAEEMVRDGYYDHTNPQTGNCADRMRSQFGLLSDEYVAENILTWNDENLPMGALKHSMTDSIDPWMTSRGHRYNLLYRNHVSGAVACYGNKCVFLGLNYEKYGNGCVWAAETKKIWAEAPVSPEEISYP